jgi:hypothetical protein
MVGLVTIGSNRSLPTFLLGYRTTQNQRPSCWGAIGIVDWVEPMEHDTHGFHRIDKDVGKRIYKRDWALVPDFSRGNGGSWSLRRIE